MKFTFYQLLFLLVLVTGCSNASKPNDPIPVHDSFTISSKILGEVRTMNVWTPPGYANAADSLPVLYMPDGGLEEDFPHIANTLAGLVKDKKIQPVILVGIENTQRRRDLTGPTTVATDKEIAPVVGGSENFRSFFNDELFADVNKRYRTKQQKGIIGESLAGLFVTETFLQHPGMFDFYIAFDPSIWWNDKYLLKKASEYLDSFPSVHKTFWFAGSGAEDISQNVADLSKILQARNNNNLHWKYSNESKETHQTIFRATKEKAIIWTMNSLMK